MRDSILNMEKIILKELGYELFKIQDPPHKLFISYNKVEFEYLSLNEIFN